MAHPLRRSAKPSHSYFICERLANRKSKPVDGEFEWLGRFFPA
jgi:hypothetical protein